MRRRVVSLGFVVFLGLVGAGCGGEEGGEAVEASGELGAPGGITATVVAAGVEVSWEAVPGAVAYELQRREVAALAPG